MPPILPAPLPSAPLSGTPATPARAAGRRRSPLVRAAVSLLLGGAALGATALPPDPQAMLNAGQATQALQWLDEQSSLSPWDTRLMAQRAMLLSLLRRDQQALRLLDEVIAREPNGPAAHNLVALIHLGSGDYDSARTAANRALRADVGYVPALKTLAEIEMRLARQFYDHAARLDRGADPTLTRKAAALTDVIGPSSASAFAQPGALLRLAPALPASAPDGSRPARWASGGEDGLSITVSQPPAPGSAATSGAAASKGLPLLALAAVPTARAGVLVAPPAGVGPAAAAGALHMHDGSAAPTFASLAGSAAPASFFTTPRLAALAPQAGDPQGQAGAWGGGLAVRAVPAPSVLPSPALARAPSPGQATASAQPPAVAALPAAGQTQQQSPASPPLQTAAQPRPSANPAPSTAAAQAEVDAALRQWAAAWSRRDVAGYMAAYADDFSGRFTTAGGGRAAWERERAERIGERASISVELSEVEISVEGDRAQSRFRQRYQSGKVASVDKKTLHWQRMPDGGWVIKREIVDG